MPSTPGPRAHHLLPIVAVLLVVTLTSCAPGPAAPPPPAATAGVALQDADNSYRAAFRTVVAEGATNYGGMPCGRKCWDLTHLQRDDEGTISGAYKRAKAAYADTAEGVPAEVEQWDSVMREVTTEITAWGGGDGVNANSLVAKTYADLDRADALVNAFAGRPRCAESKEPDLRPVSSAVRGGIFGTITP